jgi:hypothetical protein
LIKTSQISEKNKFRAEKVGQSIAKEESSTFESLMSGIRQKKSKKIMLNS